MYPAFVNCTTIDWFSEWPADALLEVADKYLSEISLGSEEEVMLSDKFLSGVRGGVKSNDPKIRSCQNLLFGVKGKSKVFVKVSAPLCNKIMLICG